MTIRKGEPWGEPIERPSDLRVAHGDAELAAWIAADPDGAYAVDDGDLYRTVGAPPGVAGSGTVHRLPIDVLDVETGRGRHVAVAHVVIRRPGRLGWWRGRLVAIANVGHVGAWNVAPRAHPNDGRFDLVDVDAGMGVRERWEARRRLPTGTHVPHPSIGVRTATEWTWTGDAHVVVDGVDTGRAREVTVTIRPDAAAIVI